MDDFFGEDKNDILSDFTTPEKKEKRPPDLSNESRKKKVANFTLNIEEATDSTAKDEKVHDTVSNRPKSNGEVYFANYQRRGGAPAQRYTSQNAKVPKTTAQNLNAVRQTVKREPPIQGRTRPSNPARDVDMFTDDGVRSRPPVDMPVSKQNANSKGKKAKKRRRKLTEEELIRMREIYSRTFYIAMVFVLIFTVTFSTIGIQCVNDALALSASEEEVEVVVPDNITTSEAIDLFKSKGLIKVKWFSNLFAKFRGYDEEGIYYTSNDEKKLQPYVGGTYYLSSSMGVEGMLNVLLDNSASSEQTVNVTFPEGYTIAQIVNRLEDYEIIKDPKKFVSASNYDYKYDFLDNKNTGMALSLEGYLFPDTYDMYIGESVSSIIKRFLDNFDDKWTDEYDKRAEELGLTVSEVLTIASIIQKEAANAEQMPGISSVIHNRLKNSSHYPMLQCDSTALYVTNYLTDLLGKTKAKQYNDVYDTSICLGLPDGPICNPGIDAINAALYPADTSYMYFCHNKNGQVFYATTDYEHQQNIAMIR